MFLFCVFSVPSIGLLIFSSLFLISEVETSLALLSLPLPFQVVNSPLWDFLNISHSARGVPWAGHGGSKEAKSRHFVLLFIHLFIYLSSFETKIHGARIDLELLILVPQPPMWRDDRHALPHWAPEPVNPELSLMTSGEDIFLNTLQTLLWQVWVSSHTNGCRESLL